MIKIIDGKFYYQNDEGDFEGPFNTHADAIKAKNDK